MKVGFYGGIANNTYVMARSFSDQRIDVLYIQDRGDNFPFSQPVWEDVSFTLSYKSVHSINHSPQTWRRCEEELKWQRPSWCLDPDNSYRKGFNIDLENVNYLESTFVKRTLLKTNQHREVISLMRTCDRLVVCGVEATILAMLSGIPYVIWPHGGDIRVASGLMYSSQGLYHERITSPKSYIKSKFALRLLRRAYQKCLWIGSHEPSGLGSREGKVRYNIEYFPLPMGKKQKLTKRKRVEGLEKLMGNIGCTYSDAEYQFFIPSRIDYYWKGTDILLEAILREKSDRINFIFSGWGDDYNKAKKTVEALPNVTFLPCSLSKPILYKLFQSVDLVIDHFRPGNYGTSSLEAMSCGTPVMINLSRTEFSRKGWLAPPVLNAQNVEDVTSFFSLILAGEVNLDQLGAECHSWFDETHNSRKSIPLIISRLSTDVGSN